MTTRYECTTIEFGNRHGIGQTYAKRVLDRMVEQGLAVKLAGTGRGMRSKYRVLELGDWFHDPFNLCKNRERIEEKNA